MKNRNIILSTIAVILMGALLGTSLARYITQVSLNITGTTSSIVCDFTIDNPGTYISTDGYAYFKVIVTNYDEQGNISKLPIQYKLTITSSDGSEAEFRYLDEAGYSNEFTTNLTSRTYSFNANTKESQEINIEVKVDSNSSQDVDFDVNLNCYQSTTT